VASAGVTETNTVTFQDVQVGKIVNVGGLILTVATATVTAANIALAAAGNAVTNVTASGALTGWVASGTGTGTVTFQSTTPNTDVAPITIVSTATAAATVTATTNGSGPVAGSVLPTMSGVETLLLPDQVANTALNLSAAAKALTGITAIELADVSLLSGATITTTTGQTVSLATGASNAGTAGTVTWATAGTDTAPSLILNGYQGGRTATSAALTITGAAATTQNIASTGAANAVSTLTLAATTTGLVVTGDKALTIKTDLISGASATALTSVNASANTGGVGITLAANTSALFKFTGGDGNDTVTFSSTGNIAALTLGSQLNGGAGTGDKISSVDTAITTAMYTTLNAVTGFEVLGLGADISVDASQLLGIQNFAIDKIAAVTDVDATITKMSAGSALAINGGQTVGDIATAGNVGVSNIAITLGTATSASFTTDKLTVGQTTVALAVSGFTGSVDTITSLVNADNSTYTITGARGLTITNATAATTIGSKYDASALTGVLTITGNATTFAAGSSLGDIIIGGSGADVITASVNSATLTGNGGIDAFAVAASLAGATTAGVYAFTTITDLAKTETILFADKGTPVYNTAKVTVSGAANLAAAINLAATGDGTTNANLKWFNWTDGNTYIVEGLTATSTALAATDEVVKLIGTYDLSSSTVSAAGLFTYV
jgi:hypothetical protein